MATLEELTSPLSTDEVKAAIYAALEAKGLSVTTWKPGAPTRTIIAAVSIVLSALSQLQALTAKSGFLALAEGDWLTLVARHVYGVERDLGSFATGFVEVTNSSGFVYGLDPGDLVVTNSTSKQSYRNTEAVTITAGAVDLSIAVQAIELGSDATSIEGEIDTLTTSLQGVTVTNANALVGSDPETDATLRLRCSEKTGVASPNGPRDAYAYVARSTVNEDGASIGVTRVKVIPDGFGTVDVYLATGSGGVTGTVGDTSTDLGAIDEAIQTRVVPEGVTANVQSATPLSVAVTYELWVSDTTSLTDEQITELVEERLLAYVSGVQIGGFVISPATGKVYVSALESVIGGALGDETIKVVVTAPAADVDVDIDEAPVLGTVTVTAIHQVAGAVI